MVSPAPYVLILKRKEEAMSKIELQEVFVLKTFKVAMDGIGAVINTCMEGTVTEVPKSLVAGYEKIGRVSTDADMIAAGKDPVPVTEDEEQPEKTKEWYIENHTKAQLIEILLEQDVRPNGRENKDELTEMCMALDTEKETDGNEFNVAYFLEQGKETMLETLEGEDLTGEESDEQLAELCVAIFDDDED